MTSPVAPAVRPARDLRIDVIRGLALFIIFIDHNAFLDPNAYGWLTSFTLKRYSFIDAADVFFFVSGYVSGIVYTKVLQCQGLKACVRRALTRCAQLYTAEIALFLVCSALILSAPSRDTSAPWEAFRRLRDLPRDTFQATLSLRNPPPFFGLLPLYMAFIGLSPLALWLRIRRPKILVILSLGLYAAAQWMPRLEAFSYSDGFSPFAWQLVFMSGLWLGFERTWEPHHAWKPNPRLLAAAAGGLLVIAILRIAPSPRLGDLLHTRVLIDLVPAAIGLTGKSTVQPLRLLNLLLWVIVVASFRPTCDFLRNRFVRVLTICGQDSLVVFCATVCLNYVILIYLRDVTSNRVLQLTVNVLGCAVLPAVASSWRWLKTHVSLTWNSYPLRPPDLTVGFRHVGLLVVALRDDLRDLVRSALDI
jgi:hypothetical protein